MSIFTRLFKTHIVFMTESEFNDLDLNVHPFDYDINEIKKTMKGFQMDCSNCNNEIKETNIDVVPIVGNRVVEIRTFGKCQSCNTENTDYLRLRDGYMMKKINDEWILALLRISLLASVWRKIKQFFVGER